MTSRAGWTRWLGWFPAVFRYHSDFRGQARLLALSILVGIVAGLGAIGFYLATQAVEHFALGEVVGYHPQPRPAGEPRLPGVSPSTTPLRPWLLLLIPALGGLASGLLVFTLAPEAEGHGTDSVIAAYHHRQGQIRPRVPLVKIVASSLTIGTGGSGGREGPIAQIGAGFGCLLSNLLQLRAADRRVLMAAGMGAGIAAIFRAPLAGTIFAAEVLYFSAEFESEVIIPTGIASVVSYCIFGAYSGWEPLFAIPALSFTNPAQLGPYLLLALFSALLAMLYTRSFYGFKRLFARLPVPRSLRPALGALMTGVVGLALYLAFGDQQVLSVLSFGYAALQNAMYQDALGSSGLLLAIALGKILTTSFSIASGGSGGVFGPSMVIGGCGGGALGVLLHHIWPTLVPHPASFVIVGMAGFFSAAAKTPFSTLIIVSEMTGGYTLLLPSLWVCTLSFILSDEQSIYSSQVAGRSSSPAHRGSYVRQILANVRVRQFLDLVQPAPTLAPGDPLATALDRFAQASSPVLAVVDAQRRLLGVVDLEEIHLASQAPDLGPLVVAVDMMRSDVRPLTVDDTLDHALELFVENDLLALPIVDDQQRRTVLGLARRFDISSAYVRHLHGPATSDS
jgi:CIC family chloride channel protein